ncbi:MAG: tRNA (adenosine(37)-N6)-dimethylallyltransferase MiaA [Clostridia bacterium]|nr:tRNA (adenosine(37)-N6)-dimethylallyltransferase MiaA [Clostridia bacterium]
MAESEKKLIAVLGPTASGKTALAVALCERLGGEAISCDSMQIYQGMDIATAKPTADEMRGIPHHLIGIVSPDEPFSVAKYCALAEQAIADVRARGRRPVLVGGTGQYYSALVDQLTLLPSEADPAYRAQLQQRALSEGAQTLLEELRRVDPEAAQTIHVNNLGRIIRALEIYHTTGLTKSEQNRRSHAAPPLPVTAICLDARARAGLYDRIDRRVDAMIEAGLVEEARAFLSLPGAATAAQAIGYKELAPYFAGEATLEDCVDRLKQQTRRYAKRQRTWFLRDPRMHVLYIDDYGDAQALTDAAMAIIAADSPEAEPEGNKNDG